MIVFTTIGIVTTAFLFAGIVSIIITNHMEGQHNEKLN